MGIGIAAKALVALSWVLFGAAFAANHRRVRRARGTPEPHRKEHRAPASMAGLALEGLALLVILLWKRKDEPEPWASLLAPVIAVAAVIFARASLQHLDLQWRIKAVVTDDHQLVRTGPYALVRHPIYLALFGMAVATALVRTAWPGMAIAVGIYLVGTEIRVRAEDRLLGLQFGEEFRQYAREVKAYLPGIR